MNKKIQDWYRDPEFKKLSSFDQETVIGSYFDDWTAGNPDFLTRPDEDKARIKNEFIVTNMAPHRPKPPARGVVADFGASVTRGVMGGVEMPLQAMAGVQKLAGSDDEAVRDIAKRVAAYREDTLPTSLEAQQSEWRRAWTQGTESAVQSMTAVAPAVALGALTGGAGAAAVGYVMGAPMFGLAQYDQAFEEYRKQGVPKEQAEFAAMLEGASEAGFEFFTDVLQIATVGMGGILAKPAKAAAAAGAKRLIASSWGEAGKKGLAVAGTETVGELANVGTQAEIQHAHGVGDKRFWDAMGHEFGPVAVASLIFGAVGGGLHKSRTKAVVRALEDPAAPPEDRLAAIHEVAQEIARRDPKLANEWQKGAVQAVVEKQAIGREVGGEVGPPAGQPVSPAAGPMGAVGEEAAGQPAVDGQPVGPSAGQPVAEAAPAEVVVEDLSDEELSGLLSEGQRFVLTQAIAAGRDPLEVFPDNEVVAEIARRVEKTVGVPSQSQSQGQTAPPAEMPALPPAAADQEAIAPPAGVQEGAPPPVAPAASPQDAAPKKTDAAEAPAAKERTTTDYTVQTEDLGSVEVKLMRHADGSVTLFDEKTTTEYNAEFAKGKTDAEILGYTYEPLGFVDVEEKGAEAAAPKTDAAGVLTGRAKTPEREPWGINSEEFYRQVMSGKLTIGTPDGRVFVPKDAIGKDARYYTDQAHRNVIKKAIEDGKPVPPEVLAEHPDLQPKAAAADPDPIKAAYDRLAQAQGGVNVPIYAIRDAAGVTQAEIEDYLRRQAKAGRAVLTQGEPSLADENELAAGVKVFEDRPPMLLARIDEAEKESLPEAAPTGEGAPAAGVQEGDLLNKQGMPFKNQNAARFARRGKKLEESHEIVPAAGGFVLRPKRTGAPETVAPPPAAGTAQEGGQPVGPSAGQPVKTDLAGVLTGKKREADPESRYAGEDLDVLMAAAEQQQRGLWGAINELQGWLDELPARNAQGFTAQHRRQELERLRVRYEGGYGEIESAGGDSAAIRTRVEEGAPAEGEAAGDDARSERSSPKSVEMAGETPIMGTEAQPATQEVADEEVGPGGIGEARPGEAADREPGERADVRGAAAVADGQRAGAGVEAVPGEAGEAEGGAPAQPAGGEPGAGTAEGKGRAPRRGRGEGARPDRGAAGGPGALLEPAGPAAGERGDRDTELPAQLAPEDRNHVIAADDVIVPAGDEAKIKANVKAIELVKRLLAEDRNPSPEEKKVLAQYVGWGAFAQKVFNDDFTRNLDAFAEGRRTPEQVFWRPSELDKFRDWERKYGKKLHPKLGGALTQEEWDAARASTLNAYYTDRGVIERMWALVARLGFKGGAVLEPAAGVGHFIGLMPEGIAAKSRVNAVELDPITGQILAKLYPQARVQVSGFEKSRGIPDNSQDLVVSNFPFGKFSVFDPKRKQYEKWSIHNYFFGRSIDAVRPGGLVVAITSHFTMDAVTNGEIRAALGQKADFVGGIRLPYTAFKKNAGTEVVTDILVFRKKDASSYGLGQDFRVAAEIPVGKEGKASVNEYFVKHPEMVLGTHALTGSMYGENEYTVEPAAGDLGEQIGKAIAAFPENILGEGNAAEAAAENVRYAKLSDLDGGLVERDGEILMVAEGKLVAPTLIDSKGREVPALSSENRKARAAQYIKIREVHKKLIERSNRPEATEAEIGALRADLNREYDSFVSRFGNIGDPGNSFLKKIDIEFPVVDALENEDTAIVADVVKSGKNKGQPAQRKIKTFSKSDVFTKRTIYPFVEPDTAESLEDAAGLSEVYRAGLDTGYIARLIGRDETDVRAELVEKGLAFENPETGRLEAADIYLSGNVKKKLRLAEAAAEENPAYAGNVKALAAVQPAPVDIEFISFRLGSTWIPADAVKDFLNETMGVEAEVAFTKNNEMSRWHVNAMGGYNAALNTETWGAGGVSGHELATDALNLKRTVVMVSYRDEEGISRTRKDPDSTEAAQAKQEEIQEEFVRWAKGHDRWKKDLAEVYNEEKNGHVLLKSTTPAIESFPGANPAIKLRPLQKRFVGRGLRESTIFSYGVGTGKTYSFISLAMEMRRIGTAKKPMIVVQGATIGQYRKAFNQLYPAARVLVPDEKQRAARYRQRLLSQIATGDWDAVILPHSFFDGIADDVDREVGFINEQLEMIEEAIAEAESEEGKGSFRVKDLEALKKRKRQRLEKALARRKDKALSFEQMGVDALLVDEAHAYKRSEFFTKMGSVKGIDQGASQRSTSLLLKARYVQEKTGGKNVILATGTPISNTTAELWTIVRYVRPDLLQEYGIELFDDFAANFGKTQTALEETETGTYREVERFNKYMNGPELLTMWRTAADVQLTRDAGLRLPDIVGGKPEFVTVERTPQLNSFIDQLRAARDAWDKLGGKEKRESRHVPLVLFGLAKKAAVDMRLVNPRYEDHPDSKLNKVVEQVFEIWKGTTGNRSTQVVFLDSYRDASGRFNAYEDIKKKLIDKGVPAEEIGVITDAKGDAAKDVLFERVRTGATRVVMGSTQKLGVGVNIQDLLIAAHHVDVPPRPMDIEQRNGRIVREGNMNPKVRIFNYGVRATLDSVMYDRLTKKQRFIDQMLVGDIEGREFDDPLSEEQMSLAEMMAAFSGNPLVFEKTDVDLKVKKLRRAQLRWEHEVSMARREAAKLENDRIPGWEQALAEERDLAAELERVIPGGKLVEFTVAGKALDRKGLNEALAAFEDAEKKKLPQTMTVEEYLKNKHSMPVLHFNFSAHGQKAQVGLRPVYKDQDGRDWSDRKDSVIKGYAQENAIKEFKPAEFEIAVGFYKKGDDFLIKRSVNKIGGLLASLENEVARINEKPAYSEKHLEQQRKDLAEYKKIAARPFAQKQELYDSEVRLQAIEQELKKIPSQAGGTQGDNAMKELLSLVRMEEEEAAPAAEAVPAAEAAPEEDVEFSIEPMAAGASLNERMAAVWYSQMERVLARKLPNSGTPAQMAKLIDGWARAGEFKAEELEWSGLLDALKQMEMEDARGRVPKESVLDWLRDSALRVEEVVKGGKPYDGWSEKEIADHYLGLTGRVPLYENIEELRRMTSAAESEGDNGLAGPPDNEGSPVYGQYQTPGGENYRELLLTLPQKNRTWLDGSPITAEDLSTAEGRAAAERVGISEQEPFRSTHYQEPNILVHVRFNERVDADGKRVLFIEEIQSDWHQLGRKKGYRGPAKVVEVKNDAGTKTLWRVQYPDGTFERGVWEARSGAETFVKTEGRGIPDAPFKTSWPLLAMKRMVRWAAENGFDSVAWTPGAIHTERWGTERIAWKRDENGQFLVQGKSQVGGHAAGIDLEAEGDARGLNQYNADTIASRDGLKRVVSKIATEGQDVKKLTDKLWERMQSEPEGVSHPRAEGFEGYYDKILPAEVNRFFNKAPWGNARVGEVELSKSSIWDERYALFKAHSMPITPEMREKAVGEGMPLFAMQSRVPERGVVVATEIPLADVQRVFPGQEVRREADGIWVKTKAGRRVWIRGVDHIAIDQATVDAYFGRPMDMTAARAKGGYVRGRGVIRLVRGTGTNAWVLSHEAVHWMEDSGLLRPEDVRALRAKIGLEVKAGRWEAVNANDIGGKEDRANWIRQELATREAHRGALRRILDAAADLLDMLANLFTVTAKGVVRQIESGRIFDRPGSVLMTIEGGSAARYEAAAAEGMRPAELDFSIPTPAQVMADYETGRTFANRIFEQRDTGALQVADLVTQMQRKVQEMAGSRRRGGPHPFAYDKEFKRTQASDRLDQALMVHRDLQREPGKAAVFRDWAAKRMAGSDLNAYDKAELKKKLDILDAAENMSPEGRRFAETVGKMFDRAYQTAQANKVVKTYTDHYVRRIWRFPDNAPDIFSGVGSSYGFKVSTTAAKPRTLSTILDGWMAGYELRVSGLTNSLGGYLEELETILANKDFLLQGYNMRDAEGRRLFDTTPRKGYAQLKARGFKVWEWSGRATTETGPDGEGALLIDDYGRKFFFGQVQSVPERWAVHRIDEATGKPVARAVRLFTDKAAAEKFAGSREYRTEIDNRPPQEFADAWEERPLYAPKELAETINKMTRKDDLFTGSPGLDWLLRFNGAAKSWILMSSFFHHMAGVRSWLFGVHHGWRPHDIVDPYTGQTVKSHGARVVAAYRAGLRKVEERSPVLMVGVKNGLTLGTIQDWSEGMLRESKGFAERTANRLGFARTSAVMERGRLARENFTNALFGKFFAGLKAEAFVMEFMHELQAEQNKGGPVDPDKVAERVARLINADFGGLHLGRMGRNPTLQKVARLLLLAPDWTESNFRTVTGMVPGLNDWIGKMIGDVKAPPGMDPVYRRFWGRVALRIAVGTILVQLLLNGWDDTEEFWREQMGSWETFKKMRWTGVDITGLYRALGVDLERGERKVFSLAGHFIDPAKLADPAKLIKGKASPLMRFGESLFTGSDYRERPFTNVGALLTTGRTVKKSPHEQKEGSMERLPSAVVYSVINTQPVQVGYLIRALQGEEDALSALLLSAGSKLNTAYAPREKTAIPVKRGEDPVGAEIERLTDGGVLKMAPASRTVVVGGVPHRMSVEEYDGYVERTGEIVRRRMEREVATEKWAGMSDERKAEVLGKIIKKARKRARGGIRRGVARAAAEGNAD